MSEEEEALQAIYDARLEDHSAALVRLIRAVAGTAGDTYLFAEKYVSPVSEIRGIGRATAGGTVEEEEALQAVYDARPEDHSAALVRLIRAVVGTAGTRTFSRKSTCPLCRPAERLAGRPLPTPFAARDRFAILSLLSGGSAIEGDFAFFLCSIARMGAKRKSPGRRPVIDAAAKVAMLAALREGRRLEEVAAGYGVTLQAFYSARRRDALFAAAWADAHALSAEAERRVGEGADPEDDPGVIASNNRRVMQRRRMRHVRFDERRKGVFLVHFAQGCDLIASAAAAGVCERTVYNHLRSDAAFAEAFQAALEDGYRRLEAEAVRWRLEAQERIRAAIEEAERSGAPVPAAEEGEEFDRTMKLLARWDRGGGRLGWREVGHGRRHRTSFGEAIAVLDKVMRDLGLPKGAAPRESSC